jgi:RNA polymerase sigma factor (sigma-70 family)
MDGASPAGRQDRLESGDEAALLDRVRSGDDSAFEELYDAHAAAARRLGLLLAGPDGADDLVSESFARILHLLRSGGGPTSNLRAYLYTAIRNLHRDHLRAGRERPSSDMPWILDAEEPPAEELVSGIDANGAVSALTSLPGPWQQVLWHLEVEGRKPAEIADLLDMSAASVSSLAYRAREGLRRAYLDQHLVGVPAAAQCRWTRERLSKYVRDDLSERAAAKVDDHVLECRACATALDELASVNRRLAALVLPVVLVGGMRALELAASGGASGPLGAALAGRARSSSDSSTASSAAQSGAGVSASVSAMVVTAVTAGVLALGAGAWALVAKVGDADEGRAGSAATDHGAVREPGATRENPGDAPAPTRPSGRTTPTKPLPSSVVVAAPLSPTTSPPEHATPLRVARPQPPVVVPITACDTFGSVATRRTDGVRYELTGGDGRQGWWEVVATAVKGYVLASGVPSRFSGDLGQYAACPLPPSIGALAKTAQGDPLNDPWSITVTPRVTGAAPASVAVTYVFDSGVIVKERTGSGWTCREPGGGEVGAGPEYYFPDPGTQFTCTFDFSTMTPPPVALSVLATDSSFHTIEPAGVVTLVTNGDEDDRRTF